MIDLAGKHILVTRPSPAGEILCQQIERYAGMATHLPTIAFAPPKYPEQMNSAIEDLALQEWLIFISPQAVRTAVPSLRKRWPNLPPSVQFAAVGGGTAAALNEAGYQVAACPVAEWSSEGLLALPEMQNITGTKIALFRGEGGREMLAKSLIERGADLLHVVSYQRVLPQIEITPYLHLFEKHTLDAIICGSYEAVKNLKLLLGDKGWPFIQSVPLVVMSERIKNLALVLGFQTVWVTANASHETILATIAAHI